MIKTFFCLLLLSSAFAAEVITGFWKTVDEDTDKPQSIIAVYEYQGKYYGRLIGSYDDDGKMRDTIYTPQSRAPGVVGNPYYCGMDILWNLEDQGDGSYEGRIIDPREGNVYKAVVKARNGDLIVRGKVWMFGKSITWPAATTADFPKGFKKPDTAKFVPVVPKPQ
jgi:uncharacterized protein (DUF2147 family)